MKKTTQWIMPANYNEIFTEGLVISNYKEFCSLLNWNITTSNGKKSQLKEIKSYLDYKRMGQSFVITKVKETPDEIEDKRESNGSDGIYAEHIETILYNFLADLDSGELTLTRVGWLKIIGAVDQKFEQHKIMKSKNYDLAQSLNVNAIEIKDLMSKVEKNLWDSFDNVSKKLEDESIISQEDVLIYYEEFDPKGTISERFTTTTYEYQEYMEIQEKVLEIFGVESEADLFKTKDEATRKSYYLTLSSKTNAFFGWAGHYRAKTIRCNMNQIQKTMDIFILERVKIQLNEIVVAQAIKSAKKRHDKSRNELPAYNFDEESMELAIMSNSPELDEEKSFKKYGMAHHYAKDGYVKNAKLILGELVVLN